MDIGRRVREVREDLGMQRTVLARRVGVAENTIYRIETGKRTPSVEVLEKIARELRTEPAEFLREPVPFAEAPPPSGPSETSTRTVEEFEQALARVMEPARKEALREWQASNRLESSQRKMLTRIVDPPEAAVAERFVEEFSPEERPPAFAQVA